MKIYKIFLWLIMASALTAAIFLVYNYLYPIEENNEITNIPIDNSNKASEIIENETEELSKNAEEEISFFEITEGHDSFSNTINNCSIEFKSSFPIINSSNKEITEKLNKEIKELFKAQLFNNDNFNEEYCDGTSSEENTYEIITQNKYILTITKDNYSYYAGAAHPNGFMHYYSFNLNNGEKIKFTDIIKEEKLNSEDLDIFSLLILEELNKEYPDYSNEWWIESAEEIINAETEFYIQDEKLFIHFNPYDIAAYALGPIQISFDLEKLNNYLKTDIISLWK